MRRSLDACTAQVSREESADGKVARLLLQVAASRDPACVPLAVAPSRAPSPSATHPTTASSALDRVSPGGVAGATAQSPVSMAARITLALPGPGGPSSRKRGGGDRDDSSRVRRTARTPDDVALIASTPPWLSPTGDDVYEHLSEMGSCSAGFDDSDVDGEGSQ